MLRKIFRICKNLFPFRSFDNFIVFVILCLLVWDAFRLYTKVKDGTLSLSDPKTPGSLNKGNVVISVRNTVAKAKDRKNQTQKAKTSQLENKGNHTDDVNQKLYGNNLKFTMNSPKLCRKSGKSDDVIMTFLVTSPSDYSNLRSNWRESVEIRKHDNVRVLFVVDTPKDKTLRKSLQQECKNFGDVVALNVTDDNKMADSIFCLAGIRWLKEYCPQTQFVFKVGINTIVMVSNILQYLKKFTPQEVKSLYSGPVVYRQGKVQRAGVWAVTENEYPGEIYPDYAEARGVLMSGNVVNKFAEVSRNVVLFKFSDVYLGCLAEKAAIATSDPKDMKVLEHWRVRDEFNDYCKMKKYAFIYHRDPRQDMHPGWDQVRGAKSLKCPASGKG